MSSAIVHFTRLQETLSQCVLTLYHAVFPVLRLPVLLCPALHPPASQCVASLKDPSWNLPHCTESTVIFSCILLNTDIYHTDMCCKWKAQIINEVLIHFISTVYQKSSESWVQWQSINGETQGLIRVRCRRICCQMSLVSQLEADHAEQNGLEAKIMWDQGKTMSCSAIGWIDGWMVYFI
jgi:hypothetical protein